jgi:cytochrome c-type biogenesis protein CcmH
MSAAARRLRNLILAGMLAIGALMPVPGQAVLPDEVLSDPVLEGRARALSKNLRCLVCQNQSIDDSDADLARDLRVLVRERLKAGDTDDEVLAYLVARYGDFVLLKPPVRPATWLLWYGPLAVFFIAGIGLFVAVRRRAARPAPAPAPLDEDEKARLAHILGQGNDDRDGEAP